MNKILSTFAEAYRNHAGYLLASTLVPAAGSRNPAYLFELSNSSSHQTITADVRYGTVYDTSLNLGRKESAAWVGLYVAYYTAVCDIVKTEELLNELRISGTLIENGVPEVAKQWSKVYASWKTVISALHQGYSDGGFGAWTVPAIHTVGRYLRLFAIKADAEAKLAGRDGFVSNDTSMSIGEDIADLQEENSHQEDCARQLNRLFALCISDRSPLSSTRKWALYQLATLLFKTYFRLNSLSLTKNILRTIETQSTTPDFPPLDRLPKAHQCTYHYYRGVAAFLDEDYPAADEALSTTLNLMPHASSAAAAQLHDADRARLEKNRVLVLTYLVPIRLLRHGKLPSPALLAAHPQLNQLFAPLVSSLKRGDLRGFDAALEEAEGELVKRRIYLTLERARDVCVRNLFRQVARAAGWEEGKEGETRRSRIQIAEFVAGWRIGSGRGEEEVPSAGEDERYEVEWMIANLIYKGLMKGYIAQDRGIVVLSKNGAFPGTGI